jgi:hypothetical protein
MIAGYYADASNVNHGFISSPGGSITSFDVPGAGTGAGQGSVATSISASNTVAGQYVDPAA